MHDAIGNSDVKEGNEGIVKGGTFLFRVRLPEKKKAKPRVGTLCLAFLIHIIFYLNFNSSRYLYSTLQKWDHPWS